MATSITLWSLTWASFWVAIWVGPRICKESVLPLLKRWISALGVRNELRELQRVHRLLHELEDSLAAGLVPPAQRWQDLHGLTAPWGTLTGPSVEALRSCGAPVLATLRRFRALAVRHQEVLQEARARSSQALAQVTACGLLVPLFGAALALLLPGIEESFGLWLLACALAFLWSAAGGLWIGVIAERARWGGLHGAKRTWYLATLCVGERLLAGIRAGVPPDLAWVAALDTLGQGDLRLRLMLGVSVWETPTETGGEGAEAMLARAGTAIRRAIHLSLMEGQPCTERVEGVLGALQSEMRAHVERELSLLGTRTLKPLFLCVAPSLIGLLVMGLALSWDYAV